MILPNFLSMQNINCFINIQGDTPPNDSTDTHELPRRTRSAQEQMYLFFKTGEIHNMCKGGGACVNDCQV